MTSTSGFSKRSLGDRFHLKKLSSRDAGSLPSSYAFDPDSSFASSSTPDSSQEDVNSQTSKTNKSSLSAFGARVRSISSTGKKGSITEKKSSTFSLSKSPASRSKISLVEEGEKSVHSKSKHLDSKGQRPKSEAFGLPSPNTLLLQGNTSAVDVAAEEEPIEQQKQSTRRPRLSVSGLSSHFTRTSSNSSPTPIARPVLVEANSGQGEFNLRSFRNVRRQPSTSSFFVPSDSNQALGPTSSAAGYLTTPAPPTRQDSFKSAEEFFTPSEERSFLIGDAQSHFSATESQHPDVSPTGSKVNSPRSEAVRVMGGSISAGKFRMNRTSSRNLDDGASSPAFRSGTLTPTEGYGLQRTSRPASPFMHISGNPSDTLAALEADLAKGRTTPLMLFSQGEDTRRFGQGNERSLAEGSSHRKADNKESSYFNRIPGQERIFDSPRGASNNFKENGASNSNHDRTHHITPPKLPWLTDDRGSKSSDRRRFSSSSYARHDTLAISSTALRLATRTDGLIPSYFDDKQQSDGPRTPLVHSHDLASALQVSPTHHIFSSSPPDIQPKSPLSRTLAEDAGVFPRHRHGHETIDSRNHDIKRLSGNGEGVHRRGESTPLDYKTASTPWPHHRRTSSVAASQASTHSSSIPAPPPVPSKADELLSFHKRQAASLSATQSQDEIQPIHFHRIAWPSPPCVKMSYFSQLTALHQHSLFEQHRKAAQYALAEYLRLMAGVVPTEAMTQPGPLFGTEGNFAPFDSDRLRSADAGDRHVRSRSISVPGLHGGSHNQRRRPTASTSPVTVPVPPLPTFEVLEKMEGKAQSGRFGSNTLRNSASSAEVTSLPTNDSVSKGVNRRPSAKFMYPQHTTKAPNEALDGPGKPPSASPADQVSSTDPLRQPSVGLL
ncbi:hypothetical protein CBS101457_002233 [Exobasidium rhododendri]|nr:hypothetical protein CBS101457_002233 [Exobasidium rhododendri]